VRIPPSLAPLCLLALALGPAPARAQEAPTSIPAAGLLEDVEVLRRVYEAAHPGLYRYNTKAQMDGHFAALRARFDRDRTLAEAYLDLSQFLAKVQCGHTYANFFNQSKGVVRALFAGKDRVPFQFRWVGGRMIVTRDLSPEVRLKPGTEVISIDGIAASEILAKLRTVARADGSNDAKRLASLEVQGVAKYEAFDVFLPLFFPAIGERMDLLVRAPGSPDPVPIAVDAQDSARRDAQAIDRKRSRDGGGDAPWRFESLDDRTAYLRMPSWAVYDSKWDWAGSLERGFDDLAERRVANLILDLRGNEGGLAVGDLITARISPRAVRNDRYRRFTRYRALPEAFGPYLSTWDPSFKDWGASAVEDRDGFFRLTRPDDARAGGVITPLGRRFEGRVVALVGASNSSATFQFCQLAKEQRLVTLVGQSTGGNRRGINGGAFFFVTLPNSRIEVDLPVIGYFAGDGPWPDGNAIPFADLPDAGVEPDITITPSIEDIANGVDAELKAARAFLGGDRAAGVGQAPISSNDFHGERREPARPANSLCEVRADAIR